MVVAITLATGLAGGGRSSSKLSTTKLLVPSLKPCSTGALAGHGVVVWQRTV
jgi:hypothetical protein